MTPVETAVQYFVIEAHRVAQENGLSFEDLNRAIDLAKVEVDQVHRLKVAAA